VGHHGFSGQSLINRSHSASVRGSPELHPYGCCWVLLSLRAIHGYGPWVTQGLGFFSCAEGLCELSVVPGGSEEGLRGFAQSACVQIWVFIFIHSTLIWFVAFTDAASLWQGLTAEYCGKSQFFPLLSCN